MSDHDVLIGHSLPVGQREYGRHREGLLPNEPVITHCATTYETRIIKHRSNEQARRA